MHGRKLMLHRGRGLIMDISDFLNPAPCRALLEPRWAYQWIYRPVIAPKGMRAPAPLLNGSLDKGYQVYLRLMSVSAADGGQF